MTNGINLIGGILVSFPSLLQSGYKESHTVVTVGANTLRASDASGFVFVREHFAPYITF